MALGGITLDEIDLWDDESIQKNFSENVVGKYYTGTLDFFVGNAGIGGAAKLVGKVGKTGLKTTGIYTKQKSIAEFKADIDTGIQYANSNGAAGRQTVAGNHMLQLAESTSISEIDDIVQLYSNNERLSSVLVNIKNPEVARDFILADKGDMAALGRLAETHPDDLFDVADVATQLKNRYILDGNIYNPDGPAVPRLKKAFDNAISKDPRMEEIRRVFFDESEQLRNLGKVDYFPAEVKFAANAYGKTESAIRLGKSLTRYDEFTGKGSTDALGEVLSLRLGSKVGAPTVNLIKFRNAVSGLKPLRYVTLSGMRPFDARIELNSFIDNMPVFKDGNAKIMTAPNVFRKAGDVRREMEDALIKAKTPQDKYKALEEIDEQLGRIVARGSASVYGATAGLANPFARNMVVSTGQWSNIMSLNDAGRPIYTASQPMNAGGAVAPTSLTGNVAGLNLYVDPTNAGDGDGTILIVNPDAYTWYESPTYRLRAESLLF